ncbi:hypothetical protein QAO71_03305 [Halopseudomonas sp. SMJS2]|uniref:hypothetical protein n=1 Tax=Halopseudomonas sp. SMJS2 TaxID=3041098 RepID=UPI0024535B44|nr:hypothetical protein [Halopseudomonas sp. SMJS2]WGK62277.1 hypothetical protein QAO71_03305 [Halopseudomonas sp. SMJS2]
MNVAFLFNSDHPDLGGYYGGPVMDLVLGANVLQGESRSMRVSVGDILTFSAVSQSKDRTYGALGKLCRAVYVPVSFARLKKTQLEATYATATVYCWLFQNMTQAAAEKLNHKLQSTDFYLGCMDVFFSWPLHLQFFRNSLIEMYRLTGTRCAIFYDMGHNEDPDVCSKEAFEREGFEVEYEDQGARRTIFDNYDSLEHFKRVESFKSFCSRLPALSDDDASAIAHSLEELHPKLFDALAAAARALERAETEEDYAQAALSGRRLLERTADALFPPQEVDWDGRKVGPAQYKNRLWAYIEKALSSTDAPADHLKILGKEVDRLIELFNSGLHATPTREKVELAFRDLVIWLSSVIDINPSMARDPYQPYGLEIDSFMRSILAEIDGGA